MSIQAETLKFKKGEMIIREGDISECAYILESGSAEVCKSLPSGKQHFVGTLVRDDIFGELGLIDGLPRSANVKALDSCRIRIISKQTFVSLAKQNPQALMPILKVLVNRLRHTLRLVDKLESRKTESASVPVGSF
jgi:CRP/FNR family transcriptional regulator, cyclic AMP receptor protein